MKAEKPVTLLNGDCSQMVSLLGDSSVDAIVTDPPYELGFDGNAWDSTGIAYRVELWAEMLRVAKPGSYLMAFGAPRTFHRMVAAIEDAGFEIHDTLAWLYGTGFPKHRSKLKPAWEPVTLARKKAPTATPLNIDAGRTESGRWPANVLFDEAAAAVLDVGAKSEADKPSRFFYVAKPSTAEREEGLKGRGLRKKSATFLSTLDGPARARFNYHPTVKPIDLMRHLVRLVVPANGVVLDPFTGSGTTGCAAVLESRRFVGIERDTKFFKIASARIRHWKEQRG